MGGIIGPTLYNYLQLYYVFKMLSQCKQTLLTCYRD